MKKAIPANLPDYLVPPDMPPDEYRAYMLRVWHDSLVMEKKFRYEDLP